MRGFLVSNRFIFVILRGWKEHLFMGRMRLFVEFVLTVLAVLIVRGIMIE